MKNLLFESEPTVISVSGADARDFLQRLTTAHFHKLKSRTEILKGSFTRANGTSIGLFEAAWDGEKTFHLLVDSESAVAVVAHIEQMHFGEDLNVSNDTGKFSILATSIVNPDGAIPSETFLLDSAVLQNIWKSDLYLTSPRQWALFFGKKDAVGLLKKKMSSFNCVQISTQDWHAFQVLSGRPQSVSDLRDDQLVLEFPLDDYVHRNKGCYPGQEVLERLYTYGNAAKLAIILIPDTFDVAVATHESSSGAEAVVQDLDSKILKKEFHFSPELVRDLSDKNIPEYFILATLLRASVKAERKYTFLDDPQKRVWKPESGYLQHLMSTRADAKSNLLSI